MTYRKRLGKKSYGGGKNLFCFEKMECEGEFETNFSAEQVFQQKKNLMNQKKWTKIHQARQKKREEARAPLAPPKKGKS